MHRPGCWRLTHIKGAAADGIARMASGGACLTRCCRLIEQED
jgi:hypothetical protein